MKPDKINKEKPLVAVVNDSSISSDSLDLSAAEIERVKCLLKRGLDYFKGFNERIRNKSIFIKPNLVRPNPLHNPALSTDGRVILALADLLMDYGAKEISLGDNPGFGLDFSQAIRDSMLEGELKKRGIRLINIDKVDREKVFNDKAILFRDYDKPCIEYDYFINLPKMKTHMHAQVSLALKNLYGLVVDDQRLTFHREDLHRKLAELLYFHKPDMNIIDGLIPMEGQAPLYGRAVFGFNTLVMSPDIMGTDTISSYLMGFNPEEITKLRIACSLGFGSVNPQDYYLEGEDIIHLKRSFARPVLSSAGAYEKVISIECGVCSGCLSGIRHSLDKLSFEKTLQDIEKKITVFSGRPPLNKEIMQDFPGKIILYGNCALDLQFYDHKRRCDSIIVPGCAPHIFDLYKAIKAFL